MTTVDADESTAQAAGAGRRVLSARFRIIGFVLLLVLVALVASTFLTWRLLIAATNEQMDSRLRGEIEEFDRLTQSGVNPTTGERFTSVGEVLEFAITLNLAQPNEKFLGYIDGEFAYQSRQQAPVLLSQDPNFSALAGSVRNTRAGLYESGAGEVRYIAVPVTLPGDPAQGVIVVAYFADQERQAADEAARVMLVVGGGTLILASLAAWIIAGRILRPIRAITDAARQIGESDLSRRIDLPDGPQDEIAELGATFNGMLDRLQAGFDSQRRFLDDVSHELRTPITIVRGHLELLDASDPDDVAETTALVDDELDRMNRLVTDLLTLARAEQPEFVVPVPTDAGALTHAIFDKVEALASRRWMLESVAWATVSLDPQRITQAMIALAHNATQHTEPADRISLGSRIMDGNLWLWVSDTGRGLRPGTEDRVFRRFVRGDASRPDGAGLGLAIVGAIAAAHQGRVAVDSAAGHGATFTLVLPGVISNDDPLQKRSDSRPLGVTIAKTTPDVGDQLSTTTAAAVSERKGASLP
ncbi:MAG: HAMP domain-containing histidine kinase [Actinomycetota bacterium]|nr:HAMP domain-containing histidine kinase [Actinomycetota bacterium]